MSVLCLCLWCVYSLLHIGCVSKCIRIIYQMKEMNIFNTLNTSQPNKPMVTPHTTAWRGYFKISYTHVCSWVFLEQMHIQSTKHKPAYLQTLPRKSQQQQQQLPNTFSPALPSLPPKHSQHFLYWLGYLWFCSMGSTLGVYDSRICSCPARSWGGASWVCCFCMNLLNHSIIRISNSYTV